MTVTTARTLSACMLALGAVDAAGGGAAEPRPQLPTVTVTRASTSAAPPVPAEHFTGRVRIEMLPAAQPPARISGGRVTFEPGARTAWHSHPLGQTLIVTDGIGLVQQWDAPAHEIRPGDVVWIPPGQKHWHGASPGASMTHIALAEQLEGQAVTWMEPVTDRQYPRQER